MAMEYETIGGMLLYQTVDGKRVYKGRCTKCGWMGETAGPRKTCPKCEKRMAPPRYDEIARQKWWRQQLRTVSQDDYNHLLASAAQALALRDKRIYELEKALEERNLQCP